MFGNTNLGKVDDEHSGRHEEVEHRDDPHEDLVEAAGAEDLGEQDDDGELGEGEGGHPGNERNNRVVDCVLDMFWIQCGDVSSTAVGDCGGGEPDVGDTQELRAEGWLSAWTKGQGGGGGRASAQVGAGCLTMQTMTM